MSTQPTTHAGHSGLDGREISGSAASRCIEAHAAPTSFRPHPPAESVDFAYMTIKVFSDFGRLAGKPLSAEGVEELRPFWTRIQELVAGGELNVALAQRCTHAAARAARTLSAGSKSLSGWHVAEAIRTVRAEAQGLAGVLCR